MKVLILLTWLIDQRSKEAKHSYSSLSSSFRRMCPLRLGILHRSKYLHHLEQHEHKNYKEVGTTTLLSIGLPSNHSVASQGYLVTKQSSLSGNPWWGLIVLLLVLNWNQDHLSSHIPAKDNGCRWVRDSSPDQGYGRTGKTHADLQVHVPNNPLLFEVC